MPTPLGYKKPACSRGHVNPERYANGSCILCSRDRANARYANPENRGMIIARSINWQKNNPDARRDNCRATKFGVSVIEIRKILSEHGGKCGACEKPLTPEQECLDHDHESGRIRGILCRFCNALEGMLNKQPERVKQVMAYVERFKKDSK